MRSELSKQLRQVVHPLDSTEILTGLQNSTVYLIFSANRSGEFYGYAQVIGTYRSARNPSLDTVSVDDETILNQGPPPAEVKLTDETEIVPAGYIFFDESRGTLFWDAGSPKMDTIPAPDNGSGGKRFFVNSLSSTTQFILNWQNNSRRVQFKESNGLFNALGENKPVQVAKDGTELDPVVGRKLVNLFHTVPDQFVIQDVAHAPGWNN
jgi:hypothetical protein